ncbi:MAG TPA: hypothetical protein VG755_22775 [Nannocystaceae bacterium]|nr:hypothetical protein [Nannocystaceae bacterium]
MGQPDRFDVVVVGARGSGAQAIAALAAAIERKVGIAPGAIQVGLEHGGACVHHDVGKSEAITLARVLQELGAVVDVRPSRRDESSPFLLEPDAEASATPPAPPPFMAGADDDDRDLVSLQGLDAEPVRPPPRRAPTGEVDHSRPQGQPVHTEPERPFGSDRKPRRASQPGPPRVPDSQRVPIVREIPSSRSTPPTGTAPPRRGTPAAVVRSTPPTGIASPRRGTPAAPSAREPTPAREPAPAREPPASASSSARFAPPGMGEKVELDLTGRSPTLGRGRSEISGTRPIAEKSGTRPLSESSGTKVIDDPAIATGEVDRRVSPPPSRSGGGFPSPMEPQSSHGSDRVPIIPPPSSSGSYAQGTLAAQHAALVAPPAGLLAGDRVTSGLLGAAIAALIGIAIAYGWVRRDVLSTSERLEGELRTAVADPIGVDEGRVRAPQAIADELGGALDEHRSRYLQIWALVALPLGLAFGVLKRSSARA